MRKFKTFEQKNLHHTWEHKTQNKIQDSQHNKITTHLKM
jgi:hypothetical protein